jgi:hypothetical protein
MWITPVASLDRETQLIARDAVYTLAHKADRTCLRHRLSYTWYVLVYSMLQCQLSRLTPHTVRSARCFAPLTFALQRAAVPISRPDFLRIASKDTEERPTILLQSRNSNECPLTTQLAASHRLPSRSNERLLQPQD